MFSPAKKRAKSEVSDADVMDEEMHDMKEVDARPTGPRLEDLPPEILNEIFSKLPLKGLLACSLVSHFVYHLVRDPRLWRGLFVEIKPKSHVVPSPRLWTSVVAHNGKMYMYGGHTCQGDTNLISDVKSDFYSFDFVTREWKEVSHQMSGKTEHKCVVYNGVLYAVGGYNGLNYTNDIVRYDPANEVSGVLEISGEPFSPRSALTVCQWRNTLITFGGWNGFSRKWFNDMHRFNLDTRVWERLIPSGPTPPPRTSHSAVVFGDSMFIFGGFSGDQYLNDVWEFDIKNNLWQEIATTGQKPVARSRFSAIVHGNLMYILGGWNKVRYFADMHAFDFTTRVWTEISNPVFGTPSLSQYSCCIHNDHLYYFAGFSDKKNSSTNQLFLYRLPSSSSP